VKSLWKKKQNTRRSYDEISLPYRELYGKEQSVKHDVVLAALGRQLSGRILDVGCGPGILLQKIQDISEIIVGIDTSVQMLKAAAAVEKRKYHLVCADADSMPFRDKTFGTAFAFTLLQNLPNPEKSLKELSRVIDSEGSIVITTHKSVLPRNKVYSLLQKEYGYLQEIETNDDVRDYVFICRQHKAK